MNNIWTLGITGGIGSGKSFAAQEFAKLGIEVIDADQAARSVVEPSKMALRHIIEHFGEDILLDNGQLNRAALRHRIFKSPEQRLWLEQLLHPLIRLEITDFLSKAQSPYAILVSPLLLETDQKQLVDRILVIDVPEQLQITRSMARDYVSEDEIKAIISTQYPRQHRLAQADDVIVNDKDAQYLQQQILTLHQTYLHLANQRIAT